MPKWWHLCQDVVFIYSSQQCGADGAGSISSSPVPAQSCCVHSCRLCTTNKSSFSTWAEWQKDCFCNEQVPPVQDWVRDMVHWSWGAGGGTLTLPWAHMAFSWLRALTRFACNCLQSTKQRQPCTRQSSSLSFFFESANIRIRVSSH